MDKMEHSTNNTSLVSVGIPVYNGERFLPECLDALRGQVYTEIELIISDNASTDRTEEICRDYASQDKRIRYFRNETNLGVYKNFNRVFQLSTGEYFKWASADDVCDRDLVARCLDILQHDAATVLAYPKTRFIDETGKLLDVTDPGWNLQSDLPQDRFRYVLFAGHWTNVIYGVVRSNILAKTRLFPIYNSGDYRLLGELSLTGKFVETPDSLLSRRVHKNASSQNSDIQWQTKYNKGRNGYPGLPFWQLCKDHFITIHRSRLSSHHKLTLAKALAYRMVLSKRQLAKEISIASLWCYKEVTRHTTSALLPISLLFY
jgi:glycosyltransferase involved in cell wall biosynthesis